ncbi:3-dehydroquinate synthase [Atopobium fossor]|uniref:3-dehydroquinate synthase n=1 Tax=Atopobium fossor TaxID=39487 RepID=UPI0004259550|nr:3-dehydroquinate synthase [Atopobium fossor]
MNTTITVTTPSVSYNVHVGTKLLEQVGSIAHTVNAGTRAFIITDSNVGPLYVDCVAHSLNTAGYTVFSAVFDAGEKSKHFGTLSELLERIAAAELSRKDLIVALGGGVCGDMAGLCAALYLRGIDVVQVPTSLLAMVDSSVGGKTAIDLQAGKNLVGAFLQPKAVIADVDTLTTISSELFRDSCGEVIKHAVIADKSLFDQLIVHPLTSANYSTQELVNIIARNVQIKSKVIQADEKEQGMRQILNLGHTLGHAIEAASNFSLGHGSSVAAGLCCVVRGASKFGWCDPQLVKSIECITQAHGLPSNTDIDHNSLFKFATHDKKRASQSVNLIVPTAIGNVEIKTISLAQLRKLIDAGCGK